MSRVLATYNIKGGVGQDLGRRSTSRRSRRTPALRRCSGTSTRRAPAPTCSACSPRSRAAATKLVRGKTDVDAQIKGTDTEGLDLLPADFSYRHMDLALGDAKSPDAGWPECSHRSTTTTSTRSWTARRASRSSRENVFEAADALLVPIIPATLLVADARAAAQRARPGRARRCSGFFSMADRRKKLHRELMDSSCSREHDLLETVIPTLGRRRADGRASAPRSWTSRRAAAPPARTRTSGKRSAYA